MGNAIGEKLGKSAEKLKLRKEDKWCQIYRKEKYFVFNAVCNQTVSYDSRVYGEDQSNAANILIRFSLRPLFVRVN